jgi:hypothetical protein
VDLEPDLEYAVRVKDLGTHTLIASLAGASSASSASIADQVRAVRSTVATPLDQLATSLAPVKEDAYVGPDVVLGAGVVTPITPWVNVRAYRYLGYFVFNSGGVNNITSINTLYAYDAAGVVNFGNGVATAITPAAAIWGGGDAVVSSTWRFDAFAGFHYIRIYATSAAGSSGRAYIIGGK